MDNSISCDTGSVVVLAFNLGIVEKRLVIKKHVFKDTIRMPFTRHTAIVVVVEDGWCENNRQVLDIHLVDIAVFVHTIHTIT